MSSPQRPVALVQTDHLLNSLKRTPRRPTRTLCQFIAKRRAIQGVGGCDVSEECATIEHAARFMRTSADQHVIMEMWFCVPIDAVREAHDLAPTTPLVTIHPTSAIAHDQRTFLEVRHRRAHRRPMRINYGSRVLGVEGDENRYGTRSGEDQVVADHRRSVSTGEHLRYLMGIFSITTAT